ncbi:Hsp70 family protein [Rhodococcoides kyotonense]|uniref:Hsp70 protein n=1 Tax=Rhodococcoides kyotonense TaxID=398843 RepID=A0A239LNA1_9NOCA|nr:Hsp70 family protein [Rhodococcus kyotonensis]SNT31149.1 Hsp70 protein [Rhodococcus kyotonensis]
MTVLLGVSMGAHAVRMALPRNGAVASRVVPSDPPQPLFFKNQVIDTVDDEVEYLAAESISAVAAESEPSLSTGVAYRDARQADTLHRALKNQHLQNYYLVHEVEAVIEYLIASGEAAGHSTVALYDLGSSGLNVSVVDLVARRVVASSRSTEFSGDLFDDVLRDNQLARLGKPSDDADIDLFERRCRVAKERLSSNDAVCLPDASGMILLSRDSFETLIGDTVDRSIEFARDVLISAHVAIDAVVLIGGGSRIPLVRDRVGNSLDLPALTPNEPESVAARGAALSARSTPGLDRPRPVARPVPTPPRQAVPRQTPSRPRPVVPPSAPRPTDATPTISIARKDLPRVLPPASQPPVTPTPATPEPEKAPVAAEAAAEPTHFALKNVYWLDADFDDSDGENDEERKRRLVRGWSVAGVAAAAVIAVGGFLFSQQGSSPVVETSVTNTQTQAPATTPSVAATTQAPAPTPEAPVAPVVPPPAATTAVEAPPPAPAPAPAPQLEPQTQNPVTQEAPTQEAPTQQSPQQPAPAPAPAPAVPLIPGLPEFTLPVLPPLFPPAP